MDDEPRTPAADTDWAVDVITAAMTRAVRLVALVGIPACGKSTVAKLLLERHPDAVLIHIDAIRATLGDAADQSHTPEAVDIAFTRLDRYLDTDRVVLWDATNAEEWCRRDLADAARRPGRESLAVHLRIPFEVALRRNRARSRHVPPGSIERMYRDLADVTSVQLRREGFTRALELGA